MDCHWGFTLRKIFYQEWCVSIRMCEFSSMRFSRLVSYEADYQSSNFSLDNWGDTKSWSKKGVLVSAELAIPSQLRMPQSLGITGEKLLMEIHVRSLSVSPYPRMDRRKIANSLKEVYRRSKPQHVDAKLYDNILSCFLMAFIVQYNLCSFLFELYVQTIFTCWISLTKVNEIRCSPSRVDLCCINLCPLLWKDGIWRLKSLFIKDRWIRL